MDEEIAIPNFIKDAYFEAIHATHQGGWGMTDLAINAWWPYLYIDLLSKFAKCNPCVKMRLKLNSLIASTHWATIKLCRPIHFDGLTYKEKDQEVYFLAFIDRLSKFPAAEVFEQTQKMLKNFAK